MASYDPIQTALNAGEFSPLLSGAVDHPKYRFSLYKQQNFINLTQGPITLRPGTRYIAQVEDSTTKPRLLEFTFSQTQAMALEFGNYYVRFYQNQQQVMSGGVPYEIVSPYSIDEVWQLNYFESADVIYLTHPDHITFLLKRYGATDWQFEPLPLSDGPYLDQNATPTSLTPSGQSGAITLTAQPAPVQILLNGDFMIQGQDGYDFAWLHDASWSFANAQAVANSSSTAVSQAIRALIPGAAYSVALYLNIISGSIYVSLGGGTPVALTGASGPVSSPSQAPTLGLGILKYVYTYTTANGETGPSPSNTGGTTVEVYASPNSRVTGINIYRAILGPPYVLIASLSNTTQTYNDNGSQISNQAPPNFNSTTPPAISLICGSENNLLSFTPGSSGFSGSISQVSLNTVPTKSTAPFFYQQHVGSTWRLFYDVQPPVVTPNTNYGVGDIVYGFFTESGYAPVYAVLKCTVAGTTGPSGQASNGGINIVPLTAGDTYVDGTVTWELQNNPGTSGQQTQVWSTVTVTIYIDPWTVGANVNGTLGVGTTVSATTSWMEPAWSDYRGWPSCGTFFGGRFVLAGNANQPDTLWGSKVSDFYNFSPQLTITDDGPITFTLDSDEVNVIQWLITAQVGLLIGTGNAVWCAQGSGGGNITPSSIQTTEDVGEGSSTLSPIRTGDVVLYLEANGQPSNPGRKVRELFYNYLLSSYTAPDLSILSEHLTLYGIVAMALQRQPYKILWMARSDGLLLSMVYERNEKVVGWAEHPMAGGSVESLVAIPGQYQTEVWMIVNRTLGGQTVRCVEMMERINWQEVSNPSNPADCFFVDCGVKYNGAATQTLAQLCPWLAGETVNVLADGKPHPPVTVAGDGSVTLQYAASEVQVGLPILGYAVTQRPEGGSQQGTSQGKQKAVSEVNLRLVQSWGGLLSSYNDSTGTTEQICVRTGNWQATAPTLITGDVLVDFPGGYDPDAQAVIQQDLPLPFTVAAVMPRIDVTEP